MDTQISVIILAAGLGTRMKSRLAKVLHRAGGLSLAEHVVRAARSIAEPERIHVVTGHQAEIVEQKLEPYGVKFARQVEQKGTGHAVMACGPGMPDREGLVAVLYGDCPLLTAETLQGLVEAHRAQGSPAATVITTTLVDPTGYGRILRDAQGAVTGIVEQKAATAEQLGIREINSGIYCFDAKLLWEQIPNIKPDNPAREYYLTDIVDLLNRAGEKVLAFHLNDSEQILGINHRVELAQADRILRARKAEELMLAGVTIEKPETVMIDPDVRIGMDTVIEPFCRISGRTVIGENCHVGMASIVDSSDIASGVWIGPFTTIGTSRVEEGAHIGPYARLRVDNDVEAGAHVGNFVELKKTRLGAGSKAMHLAYLGDSLIGGGVNIGAGTITCNYDGVKKHSTHVGDGAFVGSNSTLVAPVTVGTGSYVAAGSVITDEVPPDALALGRSRQTNKEEWAARRRASQRKS